MKTFEYYADEIFQDIEGEDDICLMVLPAEVLEAAGWTTTDKILIEVSDGKLILSKV
jgi:hypothetical protein